jgi:hypothetical protein
MGGYENGDSPAAEDGVVLGVDGGTTNTVCVCLPAAMPTPESPAAVPVLARAVAGCSNRNSVGGNRPSRGWLARASWDEKENGSWEIGDGSSCWFLGDFVLVKCRAVAVDWSYLACGGVLSRTGSN